MKEQERRRKVQSERKAEKQRSRRRRTTTTTKKREREEEGKQTNGNRVFDLRDFDTISESHIRIFFLFREDDTR
jgi:hypothetical protein